MSFRVVKYEPPTIVVRNAWGRMERFLVGDDGTVQDRGSQDALPNFGARQFVTCQPTGKSFRADTAGSFGGQT